MKAGGQSSPSPSHRFTERNEQPHGRYSVNLSSLDDDDDDNDDEDDDDRRSQKNFNLLLVQFAYRAINAMAPIQKRGQWW